MGVKEKARQVGAKEVKRKILQTTTDESSEGELPLKSREQPSTSSGIRRRVLTYKLSNEEVEESQSKPSKLNGSSVSSDVDSCEQKRTIFENAEAEGFWTVSFEIDVVAVGLFILAAATRFYNLTYPSSIVFDELHYGKYASLYMRRIFFFDPHPPLGKQLIAASSYMFDQNYNGTFKFDRIGAPYPAWVPIFGLRFIPALTGSMLPPFSYILCRELGLSVSFSVLSAFLIILDNALLIQSRYILMEMPMIAFGLLSLIFAIKATKQLNSYRTFLYVSFSALFGTLSLSVKYIGTFYLAMSCLIIFYCFWSRVVPRKDFSSAQILLKMSSVYLIFFLTFLVTYISIFYIHLTVLTQAGPHDSVMTSAFQASLKGGLASIIKGQPVQVSHGSQVTLRHSLGRPCWMHSHLHNYPVKYSDGRGSSHQQQVTCYSFKDVNNWWIMKRPEVDNLAVNETKDVIKHGDEIHIVHGMSGRLLNSHDVAAPQSPQNQEVSCYIDHNVSMVAEPLWRVEIVGGCGDSESSLGCEWHAVKSMVRLVHVSSGQALRMSGKQLPKWGFHQHEMVTDRIVVQDDTIWNVEEHRYTKSEKDREKELLEAEMIPTKPTDLSFLQKFWELQWKMLMSAGSGQTESHAYASFPSEWFLLSRGIAYWIGTGGSNAQIHLLGNPLIWISGSLGLLVHLGVVGWYLLRRRRLCFDLEEVEWTSLLGLSCICLGGYGLTYVYHFCVDRTLFLHHYLISYVFKVMLLVGTLNHLYYVVGRRPLVKYLVGAIVLVWVAGVGWSFSRFLPTSVGYPELTKGELEGLKWNHNWDFIVQNHGTK